MATQQDVIKKFMASLDKTTLSGTAALDEAIKACSNFNSMQEVIDKMIADCTSPGNGKNFLLDYCGINLDNDDTGAITGFDAGGSVIKNAEDIVPETGTFDTNFNKNSFTVKNYNLIFQLEKEFDTLTDKQKHIWQGLYTFWAEESLKLIEKSYGYSFENSDATVKKITVEFHTSETLSSMARVNSHSKNGKTTELSLLINVERFNDISNDDLSGKLWRGYYLDRTIAHELTHAIMRAKIDNYSKFPKFFREGMAELTHGIDDKRLALIQSLSNDPEYLQKYLDLDSDDLGSNSEGYAAGYILMRYLAHQSADLNISNTSSNTVVSSFYGDDTIYTAATNVTIQTGDGNDSVGVNSKGKNTKIESGAGADRINHWGSNGYIDTGADNDYVYNSSVSANTKLFTGAGNDSVTNYGANVTIDAGAGNDNILNTANTVKIFGGEGNDYIRNGVASNGVITKIQNVTIDAGEGADTIYSFYAEKVSINGGSGKDKIYVGYVYDGKGYGENVTINGGLDADYISLSSAAENNLILYNSGDGNDTVYGLNADDTLKITGAKYSTVKSGSDLKVNVGNGSILLKDAANTAVNIVGTLEGGGSQVTVPAETLPAGLSIKNSVLTASTAFKGNKIDLANYKEATKLNASALSQVVTIVGTSADNSLKGGKGADYISGGSGNDTLTGGAGTDIFIYSGGNDLITDYKPGEDKISVNYTSSTVKGSDVILTTANGNLTVKGVKDKVVTFTDGREKIFFADTSYAPLETGLTYDAKRTVLTASNKFNGTEINLANYLLTATKFNGANAKNALKITGNAENNSIKGGKGADYISGGNGNDTLTGGAGNDIFIYSGGNDLITDYKPGEDKISVNYTSSSVKGSDVILTTASGNLTVKGAKDKVVTFADGSEKIFFADTSYAPLETGLTYDTKRTVLTASNKFTGTEINLSNYLSTATKFNGANAKNALKITGNAENNSIKGGKGADYISGGSGNDTLTGGAGNDVFIYSGGNDLITDYKAGEDKISVNYTSSTVKGSDVILTTESGNLTIKGVKDKVVTFADGSEKIFFADTSYAPLETGLTYDTKRTVLTASNKFTGTEINLSNYLSTATKFNGANAKNALKITGNAGNNSIKGGKGADTLSGGNGNDTLTGGAGNDVFIYSGGNDLITDYKPGEDKIKIGTITNYSVKGSDVILTTSNGTLTIKSIKNKEITFIDSSNKTTTQTYSQTFDLFEDNNFISDEPQISEITEQKYSVTQIQETKVEEIYKPVLTFAKDK